MKALVFHHPKKVSVDKVPDPKLIDSTDIILKVTSTAIGGYDLHIYNGLLPQIRNQISGHEMMGIVEEVPVEVRNIKRGDRVIVSSTISCGQCYFCEHKLPNHCERSNFKNYGPEGGILTEKGAGVFGHTDLYGGYEGGQAEYARVPYAEFGCRKVPTDLSDDQVIFLTDIFPAGWTAIEKANLKGAETVAVFGCGPVGIMAQKAAWIHGAKRVIGIDLLDYRLEIAKKYARSEVINLNEIDPVEAIREMTHGRGADVVVDAVGMEANQHLLQKARALIHLEMGSINALKMCFSAVRRGGFVSVIGDYGTKYDHFPFGQFTEKGISMWGGLTPVQNYIDELLSLVKEKKVFLDDIITHKLPLIEAPQAYHMLNSKEDRCMKVILRPHESGWS